MTHVFADPVRVEVSGDGAPARFVWRGAQYAVRRVLEHWSVTPDWWRRRDPGSAVPARDYWRVEAGGQAEAAVYELRHEPSTGTWLLTNRWE